MKKVYLLPAQEDWIVDRFVKEWSEDNSDITTDNPLGADVIWLLASWRWLDFFRIYNVNGKKILTTVHHIVPEKFDQQQKKNFLLRDELTTAYHVYNSKTADVISKITKKPIHIIEYWANQKIWRQTEGKESLRKKYSLPTDGYLIGSFQRDTEGYDLKTPKLEKGPDLFVEAVKKYWDKNKKVHVVLAGWRRQYVMSRLQEMGIPFTYFDRPEQVILNDLYQTLDLYPVTSRHEGGPQSLIECGLLNVPVVSREVGIANVVLEKHSINNDVVLAKPSIPNVNRLILPHGYEPYRNLISNIL